MKKVRWEVGPTGRVVNLELTGFMVGECTEERERLRKVLLDLGVLLEPEKIKTKSPEQIVSEISPTKQGEIGLGH